jgi:hypothetical protein
MMLQEDGKLKPGSDNRPPKPQEPAWEIPWVQYHHLIPFNTLRLFWNALVDMVKPNGGRYVKTGHHKFQMEQYIKLVGYEECASVLTTAIWKGKLKELNLEIADNLAIKLCWQAYNILIGPTSRARPVHAPDPGELFEGPPIAKCHLIRVGRLREANDWMIKYAATKRVRDFGEMLAYLEPLRDESIIPIQDVNWSAIDHRRFNALSETQRLQFHMALQEEGRAADPEQIFEQLFGTEMF